MKRAIDILASARTFYYVLIWLTALLVVGTIAQADMGLYLAQEKYFSSWWIFAYGVIPIPGGRLTMAVAFASLVCKLLFKSPLVKKNLGIIITHLGALLLLAGGYVTAYGAVEGLMPIVEGETRDYMEINHDKELAVIRKADDGKLSTTAYSGSRLAEGRLIPLAEGLDLHIDRYHAGNMDEGRPALATLSLRGGEDGKVIRLMEINDHDRAVGRTGGNATVDVAGEPVTVELRPRRLYLPLSIKVRDFHKEMHPGTDQARHYSSDVTVIGKNSNRDFTIRMNEPLRDSGFTFYQSSYIDGHGMRPDISVLSVVRNAGRMFPYISSIIICIGILIHLLLQLPRLAAPKGAAALLLLMALPLTLAADAPPVPDAKSFGKVIVQHAGRLKPLDTLARVELLTMQEKSKLGDIPAIEWLAGITGAMEGANGQTVFKVRHDAVIEALGVERSKEHAYSFDQLAPALMQKEHDLRRILGLEAKDRGLTEHQLAQLYGKVLRYRDLSLAFSPMWRDIPVGSEKLRDLLALPGDVVSCADLMARLDPIRAMFLELEGKEPAQYSEEEAALARMMITFRERFEGGSGNALAVIPPADGGERWLTVWELLRRPKLSDFHKNCLSTLETALENNSWTAFNELVDSKVDDDLRSAIGLELTYNRVDLFTRSLGLYIAAFLVMALSWAMVPAILAKIAMILMGTGLLLHGTGLVMRMMIMSRPPVSTLYESIIFVGFISVLTFFIIEAVKRNGLGLLGGTVCGSVLHFVGLRYLLDGDSLGMLQAVLDSNFWLATHVVTITIGYGATFVAGITAHVYLGKKAFTRAPEHELGELAEVMKWMAILALFFTTLGTILGGIWADQSWGRFWGWDPKENGALLIVLWLLIMIHGRLGGMFRTVGFATGLALGNICVALAWFGVNLLSVGLHSYGFTDSIAMKLLAFCLFEAGLSIGLGLLAARRRVPPAL